MKRTKTEMGVWVYHNDCYVGTDFWNTGPRVTEIHRLMIKSIHHFLSCYYFTVSHSSLNCRDWKKAELQRSCKSNLLTWIFKIFFLKKAGKLFLKPVGNTMSQINNEITVSTEDFEKDGSYTKMIITSP